MVEPLIENPVNPCSNWLITDKHFPDTTELLQQNRFLQEKEAKGEATDKGK